MNSSGHDRQEYLKPICLVPNFKEKSSKSAKSYDQSAFNLRIACYEIESYINQICKQFELYEAYLR